MSRIAAVSSVFAASASGVLTRPCCVLPVALSTFGLSSAVVGQFVSTYRPWLLGASITLLGASVFMTLRRDGGTASKVITVSMSGVAFIVSQIWTGVF